VVGPSLLMEGRHDAEPLRVTNGDMWPVSYALQEWSPVAEKRVIELVKAAIS